MLGIRLNTLPKVNKYKNINTITVSAEEKRSEAIKVTTKYFGIYETPPNAATRDQFYERELLPKLQVSP